MADDFRILVVCTGNVCRSPAAELLLRRGLGPGVVVESAGTQAMVDRPIDAMMAETLAPLGLDIGDFTARALVAAMIERADLVLTMTREHRSAVVTVVPTALRRTFTLAEFAGLLAGWEVDGQTRPFYTVRVPDRLHEFLAVAARHRGRLRLAADTEYDIPDPFRLSPEVYRDSVEKISAAVDTIVGCLDGSGPPPPCPEPVQDQPSLQEEPARGSDRGLRRLLGRRRP